MIYKSYILEQNFNIDQNVFLFFGENLGLKNDFKYKIKKNNAEFEIINLSEDDIQQNKDLLFKEVSNISLFNKEKIIIIDHASDKSLHLLQEIVPLIENHRIFVFAEMLDKKSKLRNYFEKSDQCVAVACYQDNEIGIKKIITSELKGYQGLTPHNINLIAENVLMDRAKLKNELDKIKIFFEKKIIETEKLEILLNLKVNDDFNILKDEALLGNKNNTNKLLSETYLENEKNILYLNIINQRFAKLYEIRSKTNVNIESFVNSLKPPIFWKDKPNFTKQALKWNTDKIRQIQKKTYQLEMDFKTNSLINKNLLIKKLIVDICQLANA